MVVGTTLEVFPWEKEEEEGKQGKIGDVLLDPAAGGGSFVEMKEQCERDRADTGGGRIFVLSLRKLPA